MRVRGIGLPRRGTARMLLGTALWLVTAAAVAQPPTFDTRATETFRSAAALQNRGLYDLAAAEWASLLESHPHDTRVGQAHFHRGVCLFQLGEFAEAAASFETALAEGNSLGATLHEQSQSNLGLAQYDLGRMSPEAMRSQAFDAALAAFAKQLDRFPNGQLAPQAVFYGAEIAYARGDLTAAIAGYRKVISEYPCD